MAILGVTMTDVFHGLLNPYAVIAALGLTACLTVLFVIWGETLAHPRDQVEVISYTAVLGYCAFLVLKTLGGSLLEQLRGW